MKPFKVTVSLLSLAVFLTIGSVKSDAVEELTLSPAQQKEIEHAKQRTIQEREHPSKKFDSGKVKEVAKRRGIPYHVLLKQQKNGEESIGTKGDILVTLSSVSSGSSAWAGGHAGVVSEVPGHVVESFGNQDASKNGVKHWPNNWAIRYKHVRGLWVSKAGEEDYNYAAAYARSRIGLPYNWNFLNIKDTKRFYCSQLVWRAWVNTGFDLHHAVGVGIAPVDLIQSPKTTVFYSQG